MIDEVSTASGSDRVIDKVTARICPLHTLAAEAGGILCELILAPVMLGRRQAVIREELFN